MNGHQSRRDNRDYAGKFRTAYRENEIERGFFVNKAHFPRDVLLTSVGDKFQLSFGVVDYLPTTNPTAAGTLLYGLRPSGIKFEGNQSPDTFMWLASQAGYILHKFANGETHAVDGTELLPETDLQHWIASATTLAPKPESALAAHNLIVENLGPRCAHMRKELHKK